MRAGAAWWLALLLALLLQTTFLPFFLGEAFLPDLTRSLVLWLALTGVPSGGFFKAFVAGLCVDALTGAPPGFTALCRLLLYGLVRPGRGFFEIKVAVLLAGPVAVLIDTLLVIGLKQVLYANDVPISSILTIALKQGISELLVVPLMFIALELSTGYRADEAAT